MCVCVKDVSFFSLSLSLSISPSPSQQAGVTHLDTRLLKSLCWPAKPLECLPPKLHLVKGCSHDPSADNTTSLRIGLKKSRCSLKLNALMPTACFCMYKCCLPRLHFSTLTDTRRTLVQVKPGEAFSTSAGGETEPRMPNVFMPYLRICATSRYHEVAIFNYT